MARKKKQEAGLFPAEKLARALVPPEEQPYPVPENWRFFYFTSLIDIKGGTQPPKSQFVDEWRKGYIRLVQIRDFASNDYIVYVPDTHKMRHFKEDDILIARYGASLGKICTGLSGVYNVALVKTVFSEKMLFRKYVYWMLHSESFQHPLFQISRTAQAGFNKDDLSLFKMPLPPLAEQHRIIDRIENLFAKLDQAKEKAQAVVDGFENRKAAILHKAFTGELTKKWRKEKGTSLDQWKNMYIGDIGDIITGSTPSTKNPEYFNGDVPFIKPTELNQGRNVVSSVETLSRAGKAVSRPVRAGSTCVCCIGATISKCGFLEVDAVTNQQINSIVPYNFMYDIFVYHYCCSKEFKDALIENSSATTLPIINKKRMSALNIVVPPKEEQKIISDSMDKIFASEQEAKKLAEQVIEVIDTLKKTILARAFRGELGTNNPAEESAEELLKQIM